MPIATPMSAAFSAGSVVDAVAGHRHDVAAALQRAHDAQFVRGATRANTEVSHDGGGKGGVVQRVELETREHRGAASDDAQIRRNPQRRAPGGRR
jgi:hypothetical protein